MKKARPIGKVAILVVDGFERVELTGPRAALENAGTLTSYPSIRTDLRNAGARWVDRTVVTDRGLVTSRKPADLPACNNRMLRAFGVQRKNGG
jgi:putative intracellular protease/amidase